MSRLPAAAFTAGVLLLLPACSGSSPDRVTAAPSAATVTATVTATATATVTATATPAQDQDTAPPIPTTAALGARTPADLTVAVMTEYLRADRSPKAWLNGLAPYMTPSARAAYAGTDPAEVKARQLVGAPTVLPQTSDYLVQVTEDTDAGTYTVLFVRGDDGGWQVEAITEPEVLPDPSALTAGS